MRIIDRKLKAHIGQYIFQCTLATGSILIVLLFLDVVSHTAIIATLGASAFIVFTMPRSYPSRLRPLLGGYLVGISVGCVFHLLSKSQLAYSMFVSSEMAYIVCASLAVGVAIFVMVITNTEHPPASGMALGLVLNEWDYGTLLFILCAVLVLALVKTILKPFLMDLV